MRIIFIRHFKTKGNLEKRYVGKTDEEILPVEKLSSYPKVKLVFTSSYKRCISTAKLVYPEIKLIPCENLNETDFGDFEYKNFDELKENKEYKAWIKNGGKPGFPKGETLEEFCQRTLKGFFSAVEFAIEKNLDNIAFVVHGGSIMAILSSFLGGDFYDYHVGNGCGYMTEFIENKLIILGEIK